MRPLARLRHCLPRLVGLVILVALLRAAPAHAGPADFVGQRIVSIRIVQEGIDLAEPRLVELVETRVGSPLTMEQVRESILHLYSLGRFEDVQVDARLAEQGVEIVYALVPMRAVSAVDFRGPLGLPDGLLRRTVDDRFGSAPSVGRAADVARTLEDLYRDYGYFNARVIPGTEVRGDRTALIFTVDTGPRARIAAIDIQGSTVEPRAQVLRALDLAVNEPYQKTVLEERLAKYVETVRSRGYYEASAQHSAAVKSNGAEVDLVLRLETGPHVVVLFEGDPIPKDKREELVPVRTEGSVDEDLLEDSTRAIADYLRVQGYWKAQVDYRREETEADLQVIFTIHKGQSYLLAAEQVSGNQSAQLADLKPFMTLEAGKPFVESRLDADVDAIRRHYLRLGFADVKVGSAVSETGASEVGIPLAPGQAAVVARIAVTEGQRLTVGAVTFEGNEALSGGTLRAAIVSGAGRPFFRPQVTLDRDAILVQYLNRGYETATVEEAVALTADRSQANIQFTIREGPQILVDHVIIVGNLRTDPETIEREILLKPGQPLGLADLTESQRRLASLGIFRRVRISEVAHSELGRKDVLVSVEEAPATTISYGGGFEAGRRLRREAGPGPQAVERLEFAPRGFFEIGRRNLWGSNRSANLFTRISLRPQDAPDTTDQDGRGFGFNEYRVLGTFRQPRAFGRTTEIVISGFLEQAIRSSFNFSRRGAHAELIGSRGSSVTLSGRYEFDRTRLFDERFNPSDKPLIDRLFPQVRLSSVSTAVVRNTRDDPVEPTGGEFVGADLEVAGRTIGSQVGFAKTFLQAFLYRQIPQARRTVLAAGVRVGLANAFSRDVARLDDVGNPVLGPGGNPIVDSVSELPASERFFAGGDTTVRGFALDRLGDAPTIDKDGFPKGGNALIVLNTELRVPVWRDVGAVTFIDGGNVFAHVGEMSLSKIRGTVGAGVRYRSPIGPFRVDVGFKLKRYPLPGGGRESLTEVHISLGQAF